MTPRRNSENVLDRTRDYLLRYVYFAHERDAEVVASWVLHTWAFNTAKATPYLYVHSPEKQSGKSRLIEVLSTVVRNPMLAIDMTGPVLFRAIEDARPTVLLDEVDALWSGSKREDLRGIFNGGYKQGGHVWRLANGEPRQFSTFCPKLLAGIHNGHLPDTVLDRCLPVALHRKRPGVEVEAFYATEAGAKTEPLMAAIELWLAREDERLRTYPLRHIEGFSDREVEIATPLIAVAHTFDRGEAAVDSLRAMIASYRASAAEAYREPLRKIADAFGLAGREKLLTSEVVAAVKPDAETTTGGGMMIAEWLKPYGVQPGLVRVGNHVARGYTLDQFRPLFEAQAVECPEVGA